MSTGSADRAASATSHHTTHSHHSSAGQSHGSAAAAQAPVAVMDNGGDTFDRYDLMFTGPDGLRHQRVAHPDTTYVGIGWESGEKTGSLNYLFRCPQHIPFPRGKHGRLGEIGTEVTIWNLKKGI